jgi:acyl carrier protein
MTSRGAPSARRKWTAAEVEPLVLAAWRRVLEEPTLTAQDDFFEAGGDSLLAADAMFEVAEATGIEVPAVTLFASPTPAEFSQALVELVEGDNGDGP